MKASDYREFLLNTIPTAKSVAGGKEVLCRCFYCPDSRDPRHAHFYISIPSSDKEPSLYHCMKCNARGIVTHKKLLEWNIYDDNIAVDLINHNKHLDLKTKSALSGLNKVPLVNTFTTDNDISRAKVKYIENRIGIKYTYEELRNLKIVLNLYDVLNVNHITNLTRKKAVTDALDKYFLGFMSIDNSFLNMRRIVDEGVIFKGIDKRYMNYDIVQTPISYRFYTVPSSINLDSPYRIKIHIAEGPFDILSIYENVRRREPGIYSSVTGSNYYGLIMYFLETFKLPYTEVHIYPDNDKLGNRNRMLWIANQMKRLSVPVYIHRNQSPGEKDFGVTPDRIQETIEGPLIGGII